MAIYPTIKAHRHTLRGVLSGADGCCASLTRQCSDCPCLSNPRGLEWAKEPTGAAKRHSRRIWPQNVRSVKLTVVVSLTRCEQECKADLYKYKLDCQTDAHTK